MGSPTSGTRLFDRPMPLAALTRVQNNGHWIAKLWRWRMPINLQRAHPEVGESDVSSAATAQ